MSASSSSVPPARLLVVDDDEGLLVLMSELLRDEGYEVSSASSWCDALARMKAEPHDLLLLDLKLRDAQGVALLKAYAESGVGVPFLVVTGQGDEKTAVEVMKQGALDYVMKDSALLDFLPAVVRRTLGAVVREKDLAAARAEHQRLEAEVFHAAERERLSIGADLHDGLGQLLTGVELMCTALREEAKGIKPEFATRLGKMSAMLREGIAQTRYLARGLVPVQEGPDALVVGLGELAARTDALGKVRCRFETTGNVELSNAAVATHLYRIAQEAVNNALKHARAELITIKLAEHQGLIRLEISDNGGGLKSDLDDRQGVGLGVMRHRAQVIGGVLKLGARPSGGLVVSCTLSCPPAKSQP